MRTAPLPNELSLNRWVDVQRWHCVLAGLFAILSGVALNADASEPNDGRPSEVHAATPRPDPRELVSSGPVTVIGADGSENEHNPRFQYVLGMKFSPDGRYVVSRGIGGIPRVWNLKEGSSYLLQNPPGEIGFGVFVELHPYISTDSKHVAVADGNGVHLWQIGSGKYLGRLDVDSNPNDAAWVAEQLAVAGDRAPLGNDLPTRTASSSDQTVTAELTPANSVRIKSTSSPSTNFVVDTDLESLGSVEMSPDGRFMLTSNTRLIRVWRLRLQESRAVPIATMYAMVGHRGYIVTDMTGHYDARNVESLELDLRWPRAGPGTSRQALLQDNFYPQLLRDVFELASIDPEAAILPSSGSDIPRVSIDSIALDPANKLLCHIRLRVDWPLRELRTKDQYARDLRLFRNGRLVGFIDGPLERSSASTAAFDFAVRLSYDDLDTVITAYAFSADGIKSDTATRKFEFANPSYRPTPTAFIVSIGANYPGEQRNILHYAVADAIAFSKGVEAKFRPRDIYWHSTTLTLVDQADEADASLRPGLLSKAAIREAILNLASSRNPQRWTGPPAKLVSVPGPDDILFIFFAGHGAAPDGDFYLVPDTQSENVDNANGEVAAEDLISMKEFGSWLRSIDAGTIVVILDACQSGSSIGSKFRPIPMISNDFAQVAYEKKLRVLVGAQSDGRAFESDRLKHGRLTHALVIEGLNERMAASGLPDRRNISISQWLQYAIERVPELAQNPSEGEAKTAAAEVSSRKRSTNIQVPSLYDFSGGDHDFQLGTRHKVAQ